MPATLQVAALIRSSSCASKWPNCAHSSGASMSASRAAITVSCTAHVTTCPPQQVDPAELPKQALVNPACHLRSYPIDRLPQTSHPMREACRLEPTHHVQRGGPPCSPPSSRPTDMLRGRRPGATPTPSSRQLVLPQLLTILYLQIKPLLDRSTWSVQP